MNEWTAKNQRTNGPVNAHLITEPGISTISIFDFAVKWSRSTQGHLECLMVHATFQDHGTSGRKAGFGHI